MEELALNQSHYIFDLDGTLVDSLPQIMEAANLAREEFRSPSRDESFYTARIGLMAEVLFEDLNLPDTTLFSMVNAFRAHLKSIMLSPQNLILDVSLLLSLLSGRGFHLAIATNKPTELAEKALNETGIRQYFDCIVGIDGLVAKPDPSILFECLRLLASEPSSAVMVGDRPEDMIAADRAGVFGIGIAQGFHSESELVAAGARVTFRDIRGFLKSIGG